MTTWSNNPLAEALRVLLEDYGIVGWKPVVWIGEPGSSQLSDTGYYSAEQAKAALRWAEEEDAAVDRIAAEVLAEARAEAPENATALRDALAATTQALDEAMGLLIRGDCAAYASADRFQAGAAAYRRHAAALDDARALLGLPDLPPLTPITARPVDLNPEAWGGNVEAAEERAMRLKVEYEVEIPDDLEHTYEEMRAWARFNAGDNGVLQRDNPFDRAEVSFEPVFGTFEVDYA